VLRGIVPGSVIRSINMELYAEAELHGVLLGLHLKLPIGGRERLAWHCW
jgi:hypothetical protein